jgi:hypothetical protein
VRLWQRLRYPENYDVRAQISYGSKLLQRLLALAFLLCSLRALALSQVAASAITPASISGVIVDTTGAAINGAQITLTRDDGSPAQTTLSGDSGQFSFANVAPGACHVILAKKGFAAFELSVIVQPGQAVALPPTTLQIATYNTDVNVTPATQAQVAEQQVKAEEKQRLLGVIPNFLVAYPHETVPLNSKQKFELAWKTLIDPSSFVITGVIAGVQQSQNYFRGYGQGVEGYAKRYGAGYADFVSGVLISTAILPAILRQDPRYYYKGTGSKKSRLLYALANAVICKGDNGHWQPNYSSIIGNLAAGGLSNLYYPASDRNGATTSFENAAIGIAGSAGAAVFQEFFSRKLTPKTPKP